MEKGRRTLLSNHGRVFVYVAKHPRCTMEVIAREVGLSQRGVQKIIAELETSGYVVRHKDGRRNIYSVRPELLCAPAGQDHAVGDLLAALGVTS